MKKFYILNIAILNAALFLSFNLLYSQNLPSKTDIFKFQNNIDSYKHLCYNSLQRDEEYSLIVGQSDPNEIVTIDTPSVENGNILILNNGQLIVNSTQYTVEGGIICINNGSILIKKNSDLSVKGDMIFANKSTFSIDSSNFTIPMDYIYQYNLICVDSAEFLIKNSEISFTNGLLSGAFTDYSKFSLLNDNFLQSVTISMMSHSTLTMDNTKNAWEFLLLDTCNISIKNSLGLILWFYFQDNTTSDCCFPNGSYIENFDFDSSVTGLSDITYNVSIDSTANIKWGIFPQKGSNVTINNSYLRTCGLIFDQNHTDSIFGFYNNMFYQNQIFPMTDRTLTLKNSEIATWNFYSFNDNKLIVSESIFGEALSFEGGSLQVFGCVCDGSGGYIGTEDGNIEILFSNIQSLVLSRGSNSVIILESDIDFDYRNPTFTQTSIVLMANTTYDCPPVALDTSFVLEIFIDSAHNANINSIVPITGIIRDLKGEFSPANLTFYQILYAPSSDPNNKILIADSLINKVYEDVIYNWNTNGLSEGNYFIYIAAFINDDTTSIDIGREIFLGNAASMDNLCPNLTLFQIYPNPSSIATTIRYKIEKTGHINLSVYNITGQKVADLVDKVQNPGFYTIKWNHKQINKGIYFYKLKFNEYNIVKKTIISGSL
jgi:hypothetical protein